MTSPMPTPDSHGPEGAGPGGQGPQRPRMHPTRVASLLVAALAAAAVAWLVISNFYGDMPPLPWLPPIVLLALAVFEGLAAANTKARIDRRPGTVRVDPLVVARYVVLAKASALAAAIFTGWYGGMLVWLLAERGRLEAAADDLPQCVAGFVGSFALVVAALWLERACRVPGEPGEGEGKGKGGANGAGNGDDQGRHDDV